MSGPLDVAREHWGNPAPDWVERLADECAGSSQRQVAQQLERSPGLISQVLRNRYPGDLRALESSVRGLWMDAALTCPELGLIPTDECEGWRRRSRKFSSANSLRVRMFRACGRCPRNADTGRKAPAATTPPPPKET